MKKLRFALFGTGFWATYQLHGWLQTGAVECVAVYNRTLDRAQAFAQAFSIPAVYDDVEALLKAESLDFVDICTNVETHAAFTLMALEHGLPVVCQKPMAVSLTEAETMLAAAQRAGVPLLINENWRWQYPLRQFKAALDEGRIGKVFRARIDYRNSFPVFDNQPFLKDLDQFILTDIGSHILDVARYLFGEAETLYCHTTRVHPDIKGEDVATVVLRMTSGVILTCDMSYATPREHDRFPETYIEVEGSQGFLALGPDFWIRETIDNVTSAVRHKPPRYAWANPEYDVVHSSIYACQQNLADALHGLTPAETTAEDNLRTVQLYFGAYASAASGQPIRLPITGEQYTQMMTTTGEDS